MRINGLGTDWHDDDLAAVADSAAHGVLVPKVETAEQVQALAAALDSVGAPDSLQLWVMIETPRAFLRAEEIVSASDRLAGLVVGTNDLVNELHGLHVPGRAPVVPALALAVLGARAAGKAILDGVFNDITDEAGFRAEARQGREMGFDGKTLIHPSQIAPANDVFGPSQEELAHARKVVAAYEEAQAAGNSVITVDGRMIESLHVRDAQRLLALADLISEMEIRVASSRIPQRSTRRAQNCAVYPLGERILERVRGLDTGVVGGLLEPLDQVRRDRGVHLGACRLGLRGAGLPTRASRPSRPWFPAVRVSHRAIGRGHRARYAVPRPARWSLPSPNAISHGAAPIHRSLHPAHHGYPLVADVHPHLAAEQDEAVVGRGVLTNQRPRHGLGNVMGSSRETIELVIRKLLESGELA